MAILNRAREFWRDDAGAELFEYAIVLVCFAIASMLALHVIDSKANTVVEQNETSYANSLVNGY
jgi:Flp pilus assembly pilin Flp